MTIDDIKTAIREVLTEEHTAFWVDAEKHYEDHKRMEFCSDHWEEMRRNHAFITDVRKGGEEIRKWSARTIVVAVITGIIGWIAYHIKTP
jgi:hypothetical protein